MGFIVMPEGQDRTEKQIIRLRVACREAAGTDYFTRNGALFLCVVAGIVIVTVGREMLVLGAVLAGICALGALVMWALNRVMRIVRPSAEMLLYLYDHFQGRTEEIQAAASSTATGVDGVLSIIEQSRRAKQNGDLGTGGQPIQIRR
jgi:hypothetical protein